MAEAIAHGPDAGPPADAVVVPTDGLTAPVKILAGRMVGAVVTAVLPVLRWPAARRAADH